MKRPGTSLHRNRPGLACVAACVASVLMTGPPAYGQTSIGPVIDPSPLIAQGHLEGGINGEGNPRPDGKTPLMLAVEANDLKVIEYLLKHGTDLEMKDAAGETAFDLAQRGMNHEAADLLGAHASAHPGFIEYYAGKNPVLAVDSARSQSGSPGCTAAHSLGVRVMDHDGHPLADAPVRFVVDGGGKNLLTQASSPDSPSLLLRSDDAGECRANVNLPKKPNTRLHITASVGRGEQESKAEFSVLTNDGSGGNSASCYDPTDLVAQGNVDGSVDVSWQNNTDDETAIKVWMKTLKGWELVATLPPHSRSAHLPAR